MDKIITITDIFSTLKKLFISLTFVLSSKFNNEEDVTYTSGFMMPDDDMGFSAGNLYSENDPFLYGDMEEDHMPFLSQEEELELRDTYRRFEYCVEGISLHAATIEKINYNSPNNKAIEVDNMQNQDDAKYAVVFDERLQEERKVPFSELFVVPDGEDGMEYIVDNEIEFSKHCLSQYEKMYEEGLDYVDIVYVYGDVGSLDRPNLINALTKIQKIFVRNEIYEYAAKTKRLLDKLSKNEVNS